MADLTWRPSEIAQRLLDLISDNKTALLGADAEVYYGDQSRVPVTPALCVEPGESNRILAGGQGPYGRTENKVEALIIIYHGRVDEVQVVKKEADTYAEAVVDYLDHNPLLERGGDGGIVIHGYVTNIDPGYKYKKGTLYYAVQITWTGKTKTMLGA